MEYTLDYSLDGDEWITAARAMDEYGLEQLRILEAVFLAKDYHVTIWDEDEVLIRRNGKDAGPFYALSPFELEWNRMFGLRGRNVPVYQSTIAMTTQTFFDAHLEYEVRDVQKAAKRMEVPNGTGL